MDTWTVAADEDGVASKSDLHRAGLGSSDVLALVRSNQLTPLTRGWYARGRTESAQQRHI